MHFWNAKKAWTGLKFLFLNLFFLKFLKFKIEKMLCLKNLSSSDMIAYHSLKICIVNMHFTVCESSLLSFHWAKIQKKTVLNRYFFFY